MKTGSKSSKVWILLGLMGTLVAGCGQNHKKLKEQVQPLEGLVQSGSESEALASGLKPQILPQASVSDAYRPASLGSHMRDSSVPDAGKKIHFDNQVRVHGAELFFKEVYRITGPELLYLVWDGNTFGSPIKNAFYNYRKMNLANDMRDQDLRELVKKDENLWFIPIYAATGKKPEDFSVADLQEFDLELQLEDSRTLRFKINFRLQGPLPSLQAEKRWDLVSFMRSTPLDPASTTALVKNGMTVLSETYFNSQKRPFSLWIHSHLDPDAELETGAVRYAEDIIHAHFKYDFFRSAVPLHLSAVNVINSAGKSLNVLEASVGAYGARLDLMPGERVRIDWVLSGASGTPQCPLFGGGELRLNSSHYYEKWTRNNAVPDFSLYRSIEISDLSMTAKLKLEAPEKGYLLSKLEFAWEALQVRMGRSQEVLACRGYLY